MSDELKEYYRRRAASYEAIYHRPDAIRLGEQEDLARAIRGHFVHRRVLEIAAGTGWWTTHVAAVAQHVTATDANDETLDIARLKPLPGDRVTFKIADAYNLEILGRGFDGALACCWLSHVKRRDLRRFLAGLHAVLTPGAAVLLADNCLVPGQGGELATMPGEPDTYKHRALEDGSQHLVLKNYFDRAELTALLAPDTQDLQIHIGGHFWWARYHLAA